MKKKRTASKTAPPTPARAAPPRPAPARVTAAPLPPRWPRLWPYLLLAALAFGIYANALGNGFVSDDDSQLLLNPLVTDWHLIPAIFQHDIWAFAHEGHASSNYYRPIQIVLYMACYYAFGFNAFFFHLGMILIHVGNTLLVFRLVERLIKSRSPALVAAILFAVHPIHNEAVVWIAALPDVLVTLLVLVSLLLFVRWEAAPRSWQIAALAGLFFLALLTKEPGAMLIPLLAGYEFLYLGRAIWPTAPSGRGAAGPSATRTIWDNWPLYLSLLGAFSLYAPLRIHAIGGMAPAQGVHFKLQGTVLIWSIIALLGQHLGAAVAPIQLNHFHVFEATMSLTPLVLVLLMVEAGLMAAMFVLRARPGGGASSVAPDAGVAAGSGARRSWSAPLISYGIFFFLTPLAPALNINGMGTNVFTERYLYLPSVGLVMVVAVAWQWLAEKQRETAWAVLGVLTVTSAWILLPRNLDWHDDMRFFTLVAAGAPKSADAMGNLGWLYYQRGDYDTAIQKYLTAMNMQPEMAVARVIHDDLGQVYGKKGRYQDAVVELRKAIELEDSHADAHWHLGLTLERLGDIPGAVAEYNKALEISPRYAEVYNSLALLRMKDQDYPAAIDLFQRSIAANPLYFEAYIDLGVAYNTTYNYADAAEAFQKAIAAAPNNPNVYLAHYNMGLSYLHLNSLQAAAVEFSRSLKLKPDYAPAQEALARVRSALPRQPAR